MLNIWQWIAKVLEAAIYVLVPDELNFFLNHWIHVFSFEKFCETKTI
jgi:hypothetical protein